MSVLHYYNLRLIGRLGEHTRTAHFKLAGAADVPAKCCFHIVFSDGAQKGRERSEADHDGTRAGGVPLPSRAGPIQRGLPGPPHCVSEGFGPMLTAGAYEVQNNMKFCCTVVLIIFY